jgi:hypothetical protein
MPRYVLLREQRLFKRWQMRKHHPGEPCGVIDFGVPLRLGCGGRLEKGPTGRPNGEDEASCNRERGAELPKIHLLGVPADCHNRSVGEDRAKIIHRRGYDKTSDFVVAAGCQNRKVFGPRAPKPFTTEPPNWWICCARRTACWQWKRQGIGLQAQLLNVTGQGDTVLAMTARLSEPEMTALRTIAEHGAVKIRANGDRHLLAYERLVAMDLPFADAFDESARFYGLTELGKQAATAIKAI